QAPAMCAGGNACSAGETRCNGALIQDCIIGADGCGRWGLVNQCPNPVEQCQNGQCVNPAGANCDNQECVPGNQRCDPNDDTATNVCVGDGAGCGQWSGPELCADGAVCRNNRCVGPDQGQNCVTDCQINERRCVPDQPRLIERCIADPLYPGCNRWTQANEVCQLGQVCDADTSQCVCVDEECTIGTVRCDVTGTFIENCTPDTFGCGSWVRGISCRIDEQCVAMAGQAACRGAGGGGDPDCECRGGDIRCVGRDGWQECEALEAGACGFWPVEIFACPLGDCVNNQCETPD
ncbi:MAG: hypothetical protein VX589_15815, partial [Myxococcota bacterium]|nr:hypothetical protein [Myxococcota bacterium]